MIEILPMEDRESERAILSEVECAGPEARVLAMCELGSTLGTAALTALRRPFRTFSVSLRPGASTATIPTLLLL